MGVRLDRQHAVQEQPLTAARPPLLAAAVPTQAAGVPMRRVIQPRRVLDQQDYAAVVIAATAATAVADLVTLPARLLPVRLAQLLEGRPLVIEQTVSSLGRGPGGLLLLGDAARGVGRHRR